MESDRSNLSPPVHKVYLVFGPSQFGKSTFINNIIRLGGGSEEAKVGIGRGESVTIKAQTYNIGIIHELFPQGRKGYDTFQIIDVPGIFDSGLRISKEEIFAEIKATLVRLGIKQIDSFIIFESVKDDARKINITISEIEKVFGKSVRKSILVLSTKWDRVDEEELETLSEYLEGLILSLGILHMKWQNNIKVKGVNILTPEEEKVQLSQLGAFFTRVTPYLVEEMENVLKLRHQLAEELRDNDPDRYATKDEEVEIDIPDVTDEFTEIDVTVFEPYTDDEINQKAQALMESSPEEIDSVITEEVPYDKIEQVRDDQLESYEEGWLFKTTKYAPVTRYKEVKSTGLRKVQTAIKKKKDIKDFKKFFIGGGKPVTKKQRIPTQKVTMKKGTKLVHANYEKHDFDHYLNLASIQIEKDIRESIRRN